jgi:diguanylate cyclase (GGDEF)-like protein
MKLSNQNKSKCDEKLKSFFFDLLSNERSTVNFSILVDDLICGLKEITSANGISFYMFNKWKNYFSLEHSTDVSRLGHIRGNRTLADLEQFLTLYGLDLPYIDSSLFWGEHQELRSYILFIRKGNGNKVAGWLEFYIVEEADKLNELFRIICHECSKLIEIWDRFNESLEEDVRYEQLYRVTAKFHSSMDMDDVLGEIIQTLKEVYPFFTYYLLLSHDHANHKGLPIKDIEYGMEASEPLAAKAFLTGELQFNCSKSDGCSELYAPLKGKQGVYGVLQVIAPETFVFPTQEISFIKLLANTAGNALENAKLYHQSKRLVKDLQLINDASHQLNSNLRLSETINFIALQIEKSFRAEEVGFIIFKKDKRYKVLPGSSTYFLSEEARDFVHLANEQLKNEQEAVFIGDLKSDPNVITVPYRSFMAIPMIQSGELKGAVYVVHNTPYFFTFDNFKLLQSLIHHSTLAISNSMLREELEELVITDHLTKLYSRNYLDEKIHFHMEKDKLGTFILLDIDNFKLVNDTYGHQVGDDIIIQVAKIVKENIRDLDIGARWGGEELAVYLPAVPLTDGIQVAERLVHKVEEATHPKVTISCGVSFWTNTKRDSVKRLFNRADEALYKAKEFGKNKVFVDES